MEILQWPYTIGGGGGVSLPGPPPPGTKVTIVGKSDWAIFGAQTLGPPPLLPPPSNTSLGGGGCSIDLNLRFHWCQRH